jgi:hypothetical protein
MIETVFVPMPNGVNLAMQLWLPVSADAEPAPVVLEYIPYRKRDRYRAYDLYWGQTLAQYGVAYARIDTRGSGDSGGVLADEYSDEEQADCVAAIAWLARQRWCNGSVGMRGVSWGGFSTLQAAALAPPALKAIMPICASDMRYTDDAHYVGGAFALTGLKWAASFKIVAAGPPDPLIHGEGWRELWQERLAATPRIAAQWLRHQTNDAYWTHGSVARNWGAICCPAYVVGGLVDPYGELIPRLLENLQAPSKAIFGPWRHGYPSPCAPGPGLDWAWEEVRWWRHWLMGETTGIMDEPRLRAFMPDATAAQVSPGPLPGRWVAEQNWPSAKIARHLLYPGSGGLHQTEQAAETIEISGSKVVGLGKVEWVPFAPTELPREQSPDDARSSVFDSGPLESALEILGGAVFHARVCANRPVARIAVRLCEVTAAGESWLVAWGLLNLTHRVSHKAPALLEPGSFYEVAVPLSFTAHCFAPGARLRMAISESLWPLVWPSPRIANLTLELGGSWLELPVRTTSAQEDPIPIALASAHESGAATWPILEIVEEDGRVRIVETWPSSTQAITDLDVTVSGSGPNVVLTMTTGEPQTCVWSAEQTSRYRRADWDVSIRAEVCLRSDVTHFHVEERLTATLNDAVVADVTHAETVARDLM